MRRNFFALVFAVLMFSTVFIAAPAEAAPALPGKITSVTAHPGPLVGQITLRWKTTGSHTTSFRLETALTSFSKTDKSMLKSGRYSRLTSIAKNKRSITLSATKVTQLGAGVASGNHLYYRFYALDTVNGKTTVRAYPYLQAVLPKAAGPKAKGTKVRIASFNVRTARATTDTRSWLRRAPDVAAEIKAHNPGVVAIQELGPGRADGKTGTTDGTARQTTSLTSALNRANASKYKLVRSTPYVKPGAATATQGMRILYDSSRYLLLSHCAESTAGHAYSSSCSFKLPLLGSDKETDRRRAAYAEFKDRKTGAKFFMVSVHLDARHSSKAATERNLNTLRGNQALTVASTMAKIAGTVPVIVGGDFNSWQNNKIGNNPHDKLIGQGYYDTSAATTRINFQYSTMNDFKTKMSAASQGFGVRLDMLLVKGVRGSSRFENVMKVTDRSRASDHNMVLSDIVL